MLTEAKIDTDRMHTIVFGIGININTSIHSMPESIQSIATSLKEITGKSFSLNRIAIDIIDAVIRAYQQCLDPSEKTALSKIWDAYDYLKGQTIECIQNQKHIKGTAVGINEAGALLLKTASNCLESVHSGDVQIKK